jgi:hypothetical protein
MKKSTGILAHVSFWILFTSFAFTLSKIYLEAKPDAPFSNHLFYVIFLELAMGMIFFYTTFLCISWALKNKANTIILVAILLILLIFFALPAIHFGFWQVMSSIIPHTFIIFFAIIFRKFSDFVRLRAE